MAMKVVSIKGGWLVRCTLCYRSKKTFMAVNTNYASAFDAAEAHAAEHELSEAHRAALEAFHHPPASESSEEKMLRRIFNRPPLTDLELRKRAAKDASQRVR